MRPAPRDEAGGGHDGRRPRPPFRDRHDAGRALGERLSCWADAHPVVLGLPRGGVPVVYEVAHALGAPLDVIVARKVGAPGNPELGVGAVAEDDVRVFNTAALRRLGVTAEELDRGAQRAADEVHRRVALYRGCGRAIPLAGRTAIVLDDGLATGSTACAALRAVRRRGPRTLLMAAPVGASATVATLAREADHVVCLQAPELLGAIGEWYDDFDQTSDADVIRLLLGGRRTARMLENVRAPR